MYFSIFFLIQIRTQEDTKEVQSLETCDVILPSTDTKHAAGFILSNPITLDLTPDFVVRDNLTTVIHFEKYRYPIPMNGRIWLWHDYAPADVKVLFLNYCIVKDKRIRQGMSGQATGLRMCPKNKCNIHIPIHGYAK